MQQPYPYYYYGQREVCGGLLDSDDDLEKAFKKELRGTFKNKACSLPHRHRGVNHTIALFL